MAHVRTCRNPACVPHGARWLLAFTVIMVVYQVYAAACVPLMEREIGTSQPSQKKKEEQGHSADPRILELFPEGAWERNNPKVLKTDGGMLLFQDYQPSDEGRLELKPCTVVVFAPSQGKQRPVVLRAPAGAVLNFAGSMNPARAEFSRLRGARLDGEIEIFSPATGPLANDYLRILTRNVQIKPHEIWTPHDVQFWYGPNTGRGRDLSITLTADELDGVGPKDATLGSLELLELVHVDKLVFHVPEKGLLEEDSALEPLPGRPSRTAPPPTAPTTQVEVTCQGSFQFDFRHGVASFEDHVDVIRMNAEGPSDQLNCQELRIHFKMGQAEPAQLDPLKADHASLGLNVQRIEALGLPVVLRAPSSRTSARCQQLSYDFATRTITLNDSEKSLFTHQEHRVEAPKLEYVMHEQPRRLGMLRASGPGTYQGVVSGKTDQTIQAQWLGDLQLRPQNDEQPDLHVMSVARGASVTMEGMGRFSAGQLHVWLRETAPPPGTRSSKPNIQPVKMLAEGNVEVDSERLGGATQRLEVWFDSPDATLPASPEYPAANDGTGALLSAGSPGTDKDNNGGSAQKLDLAGDLVRLHVLMADPKPRVREAAIVGKVRLSQVSEKPGVPPLVITGDMLQLEVDSFNRAVVDIHGAPALVQAQGLIMEGSSLHVTQRENRMWADGPGRMKLSAHSGANPPADERPETPVWISWQGGMDFDGQLVRFQRQVEVKGVHTLQNGDRLHLQIDGHQLQATLNHYVAFQQPKRQANLDVAELRFVGDVFAENQTFDVHGELSSREHIKTRDLALDRPTGQFQGQGPGWVATVRYNKGDPRNPAAAAAPSGKRELIFLRVDYQNIVSGNVERREISFGHQVRTVYGPITSWDQELDPDRRGGVGPQGIILNCEQLSVAEVPDGAARSVILKASGKTTVEGNTFTAVGDRLSYAEAKDLLILEGNEREFAQIEQRTRPGEPPSRFAARKIMYWPRSGQIQVDGGGSADYYHLNTPGNRDLPNARLRSAAPHGGKDLNLFASPQGIVGAGCAPVYEDEASLPQRDLHPLHELCNRRSCGDIHQQRRLTVGKPS